MEPESSISRVQVPGTCPCSEPDQSSPYLSTPIPENPSARQHYSCHRRNMACGPVRVFLCGCFSWIYVSCNSVVNGNGSVFEL